MHTKVENYKDIRKQFALFVSRNILGMMGMSCYYIVDTLFVAQSQGADGVAALNLVSPPYYLIFAVAAMLANGSAIIYKIRSAQGNEETRGYFTDALCFALLGSVPFLIIGIFFPVTSCKRYCTCFKINLSIKKISSVFSIIDCCNSFYYTII